MENYIVINGKKAELTEEQLEKLGIKPEKSTYKEMFELNYGKSFYYINGFGNVLVDLNHPSSDYFYDIGNYCTDENVMKQRALHETLNRLLWRASVIAGELDNPWDGKNMHWMIDYNGKVYHVESFLGLRSPGCIYFPTKESAQDAIDNIIKPFVAEHTDFVW